MTPIEFKAWFDGFSEGIDKTPTQKQWTRIKERVAEIDGTPISEKVFVDRYWPNYHPVYVGSPTPPPYYPSPIWTCSNISSNMSRTVGATPLVNEGNLDNFSSTKYMAFNSCMAMNELGRSEISNLTS